MVAIVGGNNFGLNLGSLSSLGQRGLLGSATQGRNGERAYVNVATGNLVLQDLDARLIGLGPDTATLRTYNSLGAYDFDGNGDGWQGAPTKAIQDLGGGVLRRHDLDGSTCDYVLGGGVYVAQTAAGSAVDTIVKETDGRYTWTDGETGTKENYEKGSLARLLSIVDTSGNTLSFTYDKGLLTSVRTSSGETVTYTYGGPTGKNLVDLKTTLASGKVLSQVQYAYDELNRLKTVTVSMDPGGTAPTGSLVLATYTTTYTYDGTSSRVAGISQTDGTTLGFTYVLVNGTYRIATVTDGLSKVTQFSYDPATRKTAVTDPMGVATVYSYDGNGQLTEIRSGVTASKPAGLAVVSYSYDPLGNVQTITDGLGRVTSLTYDAAGNLTRQVDGAGDTTEWTYDGRNQVLTETVYAGVGAAQFLTTRRVYDGGNKSLLRFLLSGEGRVTEHRYDASGQRIATIEYRAAAYDVSTLSTTSVPTEAQMASWAAAQDRSRTIRSDLKYDFRGQLQTYTSWATVDAAGNGVSGTGSVTKYVYDERGQLIQTVTPDQFGITDTLYDGLGRVLVTVARSVDAWNPVTIRTDTRYDDANEKTIVTLASGLVTTSTYDKAGRLASVVQSTATAPNLGTTEYFYDADGRLIMTLGPTGQRTFSIWDAAGRKVGEIDPRGALTEWLYDAAGQVTEVIRYATAVNAQITRKLVDASGKPVAGLALDTQFAVTLYREEWDEYDEVWVTVAYSGSAPLRPPSAAGDVRTWRYYDGGGRVVAEVDALGFVTRTEYDDASRVLSVTRYAAGIDPSAFGTGAGPAPTPPSSPGDRVTTYLYDRDGLLAAKIDGEGFLTRYAYDAAGELVRSTAYASVVPGFTSAASIAAAVEAARSTGSLDALTPASSSADAITTTYFDATGRKIAEVDGESYLTEWSYDPNGKLWNTIRYANKVTVAATLDAQPSALRPASSSEDQVTTNVWDAFGRLSKQTNPEGTITELAYDAVGNVIRKTVALGTDEARTLQKQYDVLGRVTAELSAEGAALVTGTSTQAEIDAIWAQWAVKHTYDAAGRRTTTTDARGNRTAFYYDDAGRLRYAVNALGEVTETYYDVLGRIVWTSRYDTRVVDSYLPGLQGGLVSSAANATSMTGIGTATNAAGTKEWTAFGYTARGDLNLVTADAGSRVAHTVDAFGEIVSTTTWLDATRSILTNKAYDRRGLVTIQTDDVTGLAVSRRMEYDAFGRVIRSYDRNGGVRVQAFDRLGRVVQTRDPLGDARYTSYDAFDRVLTDVDALGNTTTYTYDAVQRRTTVTSPEGVSVSKLRNRHGETVSVTDGNGNVAEYQYDRNGKLIAEQRVVDGAVVGTSNVYDRASNLVETRDANGNRVVYGYDAANRVLSRTVDPDGLALVTAYAYDGRGNRIRVTDPRGGITYTVYDGKGRVIYRYQKVGTEYLFWSWSYDAADRLLTVYDPRNVATTYAYDGLGRRIEEIVDPTSSGVGLNLRTTYAYDANGNVVRRTDPNQKVTRYAYDAANRLVYTIDALGDVQKNEYDAEGRITAAIRYATPIALATLPDAPSLADVAARVVASASDLAEYRVYGADGRLQATVNADGCVTRHVYDANGNVVEKVAYATRISVAAWNRATLPAPAATEQDVRVRTVYDALGRATFTIDGTGAVTAWSYDGNGNVIEKVAYANRVPVATSATRAAVSAAVALVRDPERDVRTRTVYDAANRATYTVDGTGAVVAYAYDKSGNVVDRISYATRIAVTTPATPAAVSAAIVADAARDLRVRTVYDAASRATHTIDAIGAVVAYTYDLDGNVIDRIAYANRISTATAATKEALAAALVPDSVRDVRLRTVYDNANRATFTIDATGAVTGYTYDANGRIVEKIAYANRVPPATAATQAALTTALASVKDAARDVRVRTVYDDAGRAIFTVDGTGAVVAYGYDAFGNVVERVAYASRVPTSTASTRDALLAALASVKDDARDVRLRTAYDVAGRATFTIDGTGAVVAWSYDGAGRVTERTSYAARVPTTTAATAAALAAAVALVKDAARDQSVRTAYDASSRVTFTIDGTGAVVSWTYDANGNVASRVAYVARVPTTTAATTAALAAAVAPVKDGARDAQTYSVYDAAGRAKFTVDGTGGLVAYAYDATGKVTERTTYAVRIALASWDRKSDPTPTPASSADPALRLADLKVRTTYDAAGRVQYTMDGMGAVVAYAYDAQGNVTERRAYAKVVPAGTAATAAGIAGTLPGITDDLHDLRVRYTYDAANRVRYAVDGMGAVTENVYDASGNVVKTIAYANKNQAVSGPPVVATSDADRVTVFTYDAAGRMVHQIDALGGLTQRIYDGSGNVVQRIAYANTMAAPTVTMDASTAGASIATWSTAYGTSSLNRVTRSVFDAAGLMTYAIDASGAVTEKRYDGAGNAIAVRGFATVLTAAQLGTLTAASSAAAVAALVTASSTQDRTTLSAYDASGRLVYTVDGAGYVEKTEYDGAGRITSTTRYGGKTAGLTMGASAATIAAKVAAYAAPQTDRTDRLEYDAAGNVTKTIDARNQADSAETYAYTGTGAKASFTNKLGATWSYYYDAAGRLVEEKSPTVKVATATLNATTGGIDVATADQAIRTALVYDALGNLTRRTEAVGIQGQERTTKWDYDAAGRQVRTTFPAVGVYAGETYAALAANGSTSLAARVDADKELFTQVQYDLLGNAVSNTDVGSNVGYKVYDRLGHVAYEVDTLGYVTEHRRNAFGEETTLVRWAKLPTLMPAPTATTPPTAAQIATALAGLDASGNRTIVTERDAMGRAATVTQPATYVRGTVTGVYAAATRHVYDAFGQVLRSYDLVNPTATAIYSMWTCVAAHAYDQRGREIGTTDAMGNITRREYDAAGNLTRVTEYVNRFGLSVAPEGMYYYNPIYIPSSNLEDRIVTYAYDLANRRIGETRLGVECTVAAGATATPAYEYDASGNLIKTTDAAGVTMRRDLTTTYEYDAVGNLTKTTDALAATSGGGSTVTCYDALGRITAVAAPTRSSTLDGTSLTPLTVFRRDAHGNVIEKIEYAYGQGATPGVALTISTGDRKTRTRYDLRGNGLQSVDAEGRSQYASYDAFGRTAKEWQGVNSNASLSAVATTLFSVYQYDKGGRLVSTVTPASTSVLANGALSTVTNEAAGVVTTTMEYNAFGELERRYTTLNGAAPVASDVETYEYNQAGFLWRTNAGDGQVKIRLHDLRGFVTYELTSDGNVDPKALASEQAADGTTGLRRTTYSRDALGRVTYQYLPTRTETWFDATTGARYASTLAPYVNMTYDRWGNVLSQTDARSSSWRTYYRYNANDQLVERWDPSEGGVAKAGPRTFVRYDGLGREIATQDANGNINRKEWDAAGQLVREIHADADPYGGVGYWKGTVNYAYDAFGDRRRVTDAEGKATEYRYDRLGRNTSIITGAVDVWTVNFDGSVSSVVNSTLSTGKVYDWAGRIIQNESVTFTVDRRGQVVWTSGGAQGAVSTAYDVWGRQIGETDANGWVATWTYDAFGRLTGKTDIGGATYAFGYDQARQLKTQTSTPPLGSGRAAQNLTFAYDGAGQLVQITDAALGETTDIGYSRSGQRVWERTIRGGTTYQDQRLSYDALGRLQKVEGWDGTIVEFDYDANGNRTYQKTSYWLPPETLFGSSTFNVKEFWFAYDSMNRQVLVDGALDPTIYGATNIGQVTSTQGHILGYDKNGNRTSDLFYGKRVVRVLPLVATLPPDTNTYKMDVISYESTTATGFFSYELLDGRMKELYQYDAANRLATVATAALNSSGTAVDIDHAMVLDVRKYDAASRVVQVGPSSSLPSDYLAALAANPYADNNGARRRVSQYDTKGRLMSQYVTKPDGVFESYTEYKKFQEVAVVGNVHWWADCSTYDPAGNVTGYRVKGSDNVTTAYGITVGRFDGYRDTRIDVNRPGTSTGTTTKGYDANGFLVSVDDWNLYTNDRTFVNDANGVVLQKSQSAGIFWGSVYQKVLKQMVVAGQVIGTYGGGTNPDKPANDDGTPNFTNQADFNLSYEPIVNTLAGAGHYVVQPGDTLRSIAQASYGDGELWYLIADANGLRSDADLRVDQVLNVPTRPAGTHNRVGTLKPYDPSKVIGDTSPHIPAPKQEDDSCAIVKMIVIIVVVIAVTIATSGALAALLPAASGFAGAAMAVGIGAVAGAVGSLAGQGMAIAMGMQDSIDWKQVGMAALGGAVSAGVGEALSSVTNAVSKMQGAWGVLARSAVAGAKAAITSAATQGLGWAVGLQDGFSWKEVAAAAAGAAVGSVYGEALQGISDMGPIGNVAAGTVTGIASGTVAAVVKGGKVELAQIAADAFGNALGSAIGGAISSGIQDALVNRKVRDSLVRAGLDRDGSDLTPEQLEEVRQAIKLGADPKDVAKVLEREIVGSEPAAAVEPPPAAAGVDQAPPSAAPPATEPPDSAPPQEAAPAAAPPSSEPPDSSPRTTEPGAPAGGAAAPADASAPGAAAAPADSKPAGRNGAGKTDEVEVDSVDNVDGKSFKTVTDKRGRDHWKVDSPGDKDNGRFSKAPDELEVKKAIKPVKSEGDVGLTVSAEKVFAESSGKIGDTDIEVATKTSASAQAGVVSGSDGEKGFKATGDVGTRSHVKYGEKQHTTDAGTKLSIEARSAVEVAATGEVSLTNENIGVNGQIKAEAVALQITGKAEHAYEVGDVTIKTGVKGSLNILAIGGSGTMVAKWESGRLQLGLGASLSVLVGVKGSVYLDVDVSKLLDRWFKPPAPPPPPVPGAANPSGP